MWEWYKNTERWQTPELQESVESLAEHVELNQFLIFTSSQHLLLSNKCLNGFWEVKQKRISAFSLSLGTSQAAVFHLLIFGPKLKLFFQNLRIICLSYSSLVEDLQCFLAYHGKYCLLIWKERFLLKILNVNSSSTFFFLILVFGFP